MCDEEEGTDVFDTIEEYLDWWARYREATEDQVRRAVESLGPLKPQVPIDEALGHISISTE